jgi:hypothetical protein
MWRRSVINKIHFVSMLERVATNAADRGIRAAWRGWKSNAVADHTAL